MALFWRSAVMSVWVGVLVPACIVEFDEPGRAIEAQAGAIVNGSIDVGDPAVAYVVMFADTGSGRSAVGSCSATVVARRALLTARHCIRRSEADGLLPAGYVFPAADVAAAFATSPGPSDPLFAVRSHIIHPTADIAVLELAEAAPSEPALMNAVEMGPLVGDPVRLVGFGRTASAASDGGVKRAGVATLLGFDNRSPEYGELAMTGLGANPDGSQLCFGDSGGPAFMQVAGAERIIGVNALLERPANIPGEGVQCEDPETVNGVVRVDRYLDWIEQFIADVDANTDLASGSGPSSGGSSSGSGSAARGDPRGGGCSAAPGGSGSGLLLLLLAVYGLRSTVYGKRSTVDGRRSTVDGRRKTEDGRRKTEGRRKTDNGQRLTANGA